MKNIFHTAGIFNTTNKQKTKKSSTCGLYLYELMLITFVVLVNNNKDLFFRYLRCQSRPSLIVTQLSVLSLRRGFVLISFAQQVHSGLVALTLCTQEDAAILSLQNKKNIGFTG